MVAPTQTNPELDDPSFEDYTSQGGDFETVPTNSYDLEFTGFRTVQKNDAKIQRDFALKQASKPGQEIRIEDIDIHQWEWSWTIVNNEECDGIVLKDWTTRTFHKNSKAGKIAASLAGVDEYDVAVMQQFGSIKKLLGRRIRGYVEEKEGQNGGLRNYVKVYSKMPPPRPRANRNAPQAPQTPVTPDPAITLSDDDFWPETPTA